MIPRPLSQIGTIPDPSLNEKLVPANDNHEPSALSRENLEAESILAPHDDMTPGISPLIFAGVLCLLFAFVFAVWNH